MSRRTSQTLECTRRGSPGGSIRLVCRGTALPLANRRGRARGSAPPPGPLLGVPSVPWAANHRPYVAGKREAHHAKHRTICDALMAEMPGEITFAINGKLLAGGVTASDEEVGAAMAFAFRELKLVVEPGGAVGLAALLSGRLEAQGKNVVIVLSGGNVDADLYAKLIA